MAQNPPAAIGPPLPQPDLLDIVQNMNAISQTHLALSQNFNNLTTQVQRIPNVPAVSNAQQLNEAMQGVNQRLDTMQQSLNQNSTNLDQRFNTMLQTMDERFNTMLQATQRSMDERFNAMLQASQQSMDQRFNAMQQTQEARFTTMQQRAAEGLLGMRQEIVTGLDALSRDLDNMGHNITGRLNVVSDRLDGVEQGLGGVINRLDDVDQRLVAVDGSLGRLRADLAWEHQVSYARTRNSIAGSGTFEAIPPRPDLPQYDPIAFPQRLDRIRYMTQDHCAQLAAAWGIDLTGLETVEDARQRVVRFIGVNN